MVIRPACAAGHNYPADADELITVIAQLLLAFPVADFLPHALIVPHHEISNSGEITAAAYRHLSKRSSTINQVIIVSSLEEHKSGIFLPASDVFSTPLGQVPIDRALVDCFSSLPFVEINDSVHYHSPRIEVQLPFLQTCLTDFSVMPVLIGDVEKDDLSQFFHRLPINKNTLIILSVDVKEEDVATADLEEQVLFVCFLEFCNDVNWRVQSALAKTESSSQTIAASFIAH